MGFELFSPLTIMNIVTIDSPFFLRCIFGCGGSFAAACGLSLVAMSAGYFVVVLWASYCRGLPEQALGARLQQLEHVGLIVVAHRLCCSAACGILPDRPGCVPCIARCIF